MLIHENDKVVPEPSQGRKKSSGLCGHRHSKIHISTQAEKEFFVEFPEKYPPLLRNMNTVPHFISLIQPLDFYPVYNLTRVLYKDQPPNADLMTVISP